MDVWDSVARNLNTLDEFNRRHFDGKRAQARFNLLLRDHKERNVASNRPSGSDEVVDERVVLLDDLSSQVEEAKKEEADRADSEAEAAARAEESVVLVREEEMKSQGKRKNREGDDEAAGGKMPKVLTLMNDANKSELELRKFMFEKELEEHQKERGASQGTRGPS
ncbi:hypothetical protein DYB32_006285 [Aphanomyces invadans]|uniref:Uncharacterized protein n=2 Tax=Aphanomyces invadans TaxID=157072 RepID=A0A3R7A726_9STRA|nr:hypothetical protein DYB32_006285 [Aphanomyces invadans]